MEQDNELLLFDRLNVIKDTINKYGEENFYLSFSGGKDSTILHYLIDMALPNNQIPRVYIDTGIEYQAIRDFVLNLAKNDNRFQIIKPSKPIIKTLQDYGYPFKSKEHSHHVMIYQSSGMGLAVQKYLKIVVGNRLICCPQKLKYQFSNDFNIKVSDKCCLKMKKEPVHKWEKDNGRTIAMTGMRNAEGGQRASIKGCILTDKKTGKVKKFHPLIKVDDTWENWFVDKIEKEKDSRILCELYYQPFNFKRTGCKGCPFSLDLQEQLDTMELLLPNEKRQCEIIWKPIYDEYRRIGYRLKKRGESRQLSLFDEE